MRRMPLALVLAVVALALLALLALTPARAVLTERVPLTWRVALAAWRQGVQIDHDQVVPMPDGVRLSASLYRPKGATGPLPTVLVMLPYHRLKYGEGFNSGLFFARHGYAVLVLDLRGTGDSGGEFLPWRGVAEDGAATLDWIARQPWSTGRVGTFGCSALGETQFVLGRAGHPRHQAMIASGAGGAVGSALGRYSYFGSFEGGVFQLASGFGWFTESGAKSQAVAPPAEFDTASVLRELPVSGLVRRVRPGPNSYDDFLGTPLGDPAWERWGYLSDADRIAQPALVINGWGDQTIGETLAYAEHMRRSNPPEVARRQKVVIAPSAHCQHEETGTRFEQFGVMPVTGASRPYRDWYLALFDRWLADKGDGLDAMPAYTYYLLGADRWLGADQWPPADVQWQRWHLGSDGRANSRDGNGRLAPERSGSAASDRFRYDPLDPVPSRGGPLCCTGNDADPRGPADQADVERRDDVLVYTTAPLERDLDIAGPLRARLTFSSSARDTDVVLRVADVAPDGRSLGLQEGALRLRYRDGAAPRLMTPGERYAVTVDLRAIAARIARGHRLRLHVTSSSFPRLERNLNGGAASVADETEPVVATNTIHYDAPQGSYLELPVLPPQAAR